MIQTIEIYFAEKIYILHLKIIYDITEFTKILISGLFWISMQKSSVFIRMVLFIDKYSSSP